MLTLDFPDSYASLAGQLALDRGLAYTPLWSAGADFLQLVVDHCLAQGPQHILECSSGLSTLVLARCCQMTGQGRVVSLENGAQYADKTRAALSAYGLDDWAEVVDAPLCDTPLRDGSHFQWYQLDGLTSHKPFDLLVIDGPPGFLQPRSRYPALPLLFERLAPRCHIFLDDAARDDERLLVAQWLDGFPVTSHRYHETERGCTELTLAG